MRRVLPCPAFELRHHAVELHARFGEQWRSFALLAPRNPEPAFSLEELMAR